jgi:hypothetical protein
MKKLSFLMNHARCSPSDMSPSCATPVDVVLARCTGNRQHQDWRRLVGLVRVARRRRCLGTVTGGPTVTVYSPPMTGNRPELPGSHRGSR